MQELEVKIDGTKFQSNCLNKIFDIINEDKLGFTYSFEEIIIKFTDNFLALIWLVNLPKKLSKLGITYMPTDGITFKVSNI